MRVDARTFERVAGVDEEGERPALAQRLLELEAAGRERRAADDVAVGVEWAECLEPVAAHAVVAAGEETHRGGQLGELALGRRAELAAHEKTLAARRRPDP